MWSARSTRVRRKRQCGSCRWSGKLRLRPTTTRSSRRATTPASVEPSGARTRTLTPCFYSPAPPAGMVGAWAAGIAYHAAAWLRAQPHRARRSGAKSPARPYGSLRLTRWGNVRSSSGASCSPTRLSGDRLSPGARAGTVSHSSLGGGQGVRRACRRAPDQRNDRHRPRCLIGYRLDQPGAGGPRAGGESQRSKSSKSPS